MSETSLAEAILEKLKTVIDPETNTDVVRMRLVENLWVDVLGKVRYTFRPSSFVCPIAVTLALDIKAAVSQVPGVQSQEIAIADYMMAEELEKIINQET
ncbi:MAG: iron-sulfur cluster assembly protein [Chloroflexota bacterium]